MFTYLLMSVYLNLIHALTHSTTRAGFTLLYVKGKMSEYRTQLFIIQMVFLVIWHYLKSYLNTWHQSVRYSDEPRFGCLVFGSPLYQLFIFCRINVTTHHSDFKELVPEFYMPENKVSKLGQIGVAICFLKHWCCGRLVKKVMILSSFWCEYTLE